MLHEKVYIPKLELAAKPYIGIPYTVDIFASNPSFTCWTFVQHIYNANYNFNLPLNFMVTCDKFIEVWSKFDNLEYLQFIKEWDLALFSFNNKNVDHCGLLIYPEKIVHCIPEIGVCIESLRKYEQYLFQIARLQYLY